MSEDNKKISQEVIKRLPRYYRFLRDLLNEDISRISSKQLGEKMNITASQIRQDFNCFGGFGQQGYGYNVDSLYNTIGNILGLHNDRKMIIIGAGNIGHALANYKSLGKLGFKLVGIFDNNPDIIGEKTSGFTVKDINDLKDFTEKNIVDIAVIAVPRQAANETASKLIECGIKGILNFAYVDLNVPENVSVENVHVSDSLMTLSYKIKSKNEK